MIPSAQKTLSYNKRIFECLENIRILVFFFMPRDFIHSASDAGAGFMWSWVGMGRFTVTIIYASHMSVLK